MTSANNELIGSTMGTSAKEEVVSKVDEEDKESSSDSDMDDGSDSEWAEYNMLPETEPEWDVDSFDGHEFKINPRVRKMYGSNQHLYDEYYNERLEAFHSKGFLPDPLNGIYNLHIDGQGNHRDLAANLANVCVQKFNETKVTTLEFVSVVRVTVSGAATWKLYITFMAREFRDGPLVEYQAKVIHAIGTVGFFAFPIMNSQSIKVKEEDKEDDGDYDSDDIIEEEDKEDDGDDDSDDVKEEDREDDASDNGYTVWRGMRFKYVPEKEPEWDVDSYDGREYESDPEDRKHFTSEEQYNEYRLDKLELLESKGFIPDYANGIYPFGDLEASAGENRTNRDELTHLASLCFKKLNEYKGKCVELVSIERATVSGGARWKIYITCMAREYEDGPLVEYQAKVMR
ncbi:Cystatin-related plant, partial [Arabidopsis thaliana x Arabidopsis arenosa]